MGNQNPRSPPLFVPLTDRVPCCLVSFHQECQDGSQNIVLKCSHPSTKASDNHLNGSCLRLLFVWEFQNYLFKGKTVIYLMFNPVYYLRFPIVQHAGISVEQGGVVFATPSRLAWPGGFKIVPSIPGFVRPQLRVFSKDSCIKYRSFLWIMRKM